MSVLFIIAVILFISNPKAFLRVIFALLVALLMFLTSANVGYGIFTLIVLAFPWGKWKKRK